MNTTTKHTHHTGTRAHPDNTGDARSKRRAYRWRADTMQHLDALKHKTGLSEAAIVRMAVRKLATAENIDTAA